MKKIIASICGLLMMGMVSAQQMGTEEIAQQYMELSTVLGSTRNEVEKHLDEWGYRQDDSTSFNLSRLVSWALRAGGAGKETSRRAHEMDLRVWMRQYTLSRGDEELDLLTFYANDKMFGFTLYYRSTDVAKVFATTGHMAQLQKAAATARRALQYKGELSGKKKKRFACHDDLVRALSETGLDDTKKYEEHYADKDNSCTFSVRYTNFRQGKKNAPQDAVAVMSLDVTNHDLMW